MRKYNVLLLLFVLACPSVDGGMEEGDVLESFVGADAGFSAISNRMDAGLVEESDAGEAEEGIITLDAGALEQGYSSDENVISICIEGIQSPDGGFQNDIGIVKGERASQRITVTVTLFNVNCGITEFNLLMEETESNTVLKTTVSPVNLSNETPLTRCHCDMDLTAVYVDTDASLDKVSAYFYSEVVLDNVNAIPENGFIGEISLQ